MPGSKLRQLPLRRFLPRHFPAPATATLGAPFVFALALAALAAPLPSGSAAAQFLIGGHGVYQNKLQDGTFGAGGRVEVALDFLFRGLALAGTYDHLFPSCESCSSWQAGGQLVVGNGPLYVGVAPVYHRFDPGPDYEPPEGVPATGVTEEWTWNLVAGVKIPQLPVITPIVEFRQQVGSSTGNQQMIVAGILVGPSSRRNAPRPPGPPSGARPPRSR